MQSYENNPEANEKAFTDGWLRTGDQGFLDAIFKIMVRTNTAQQIAPDSFRQLLQQQTILGLVPRLGTHHEGRPTRFVRFILVAIRLGHTVLAGTAPPGGRHPGSIHTSDRDSGHRVPPVVQFWAKNLVAVRALTAQIMKTVANMHEALI